MIVGMDFGTTNSGMAVFDGREVNVLPLDPASANPRVIRTAVYATNEQTLHIGRGAIDTYFTQNVGRSVKTKRIWVGEIEIRGGDMYYVTDVYVYVDVLAPGRLFLSMKTGLRDPDYSGSIVGQNFYALEDLIALYLNITKVRAEKVLGRKLTQVVLGRPVRFANQSEHDRLAQGRLLQAALKAGYEQVFFQYEPIAAAYSYERTISEPQNVLVFDFGGGTLDLTVMRLGDDTAEKVLATGGIPVAGDVFDQKLVRAKLPQHFGEGSYYGIRSKKLKVPPWIFDTFANWQTILELQTAQNKEMLKEIAQTAQRRHQIEALISLVSSNYGQRMFDIVELAKRDLSSKRGAQIHLQGPGFNVIEFVTRSEFETIILHEILAIKSHIDDVTLDSGLLPEQIDAVIRTGGSSQIPVFDEMLKEKFGVDKVLAIDTFSSVTAGLGVIGHGIEHGAIESRVFTEADSDHQPQKNDNGPMISPVNLDLMQRRILIQEGVLEDVGQGVARTLVVLGDAKQITAVPLPTLSDNLDLAELGITQPVNAAVVAGLDETLLVITSHYRFLLMTPRQLLERQSVQVALDDVYMLGQRESLCSISRWEPIKSCDKLLIVTSLGLARPYPLRVMQESIEAPVPLKFDNQLLGVPILATGANGGDQLAVITTQGRAQRIAVSDLRGSGTILIKSDRDNRVSGATLCQARDELLLVTADGYGRRLQAREIGLMERENQKGKAYVARRSAVVALGRGDYWLATSSHLCRLEAQRVALDGSTRTTRLLTLAGEETVVTAVDTSLVTEN